MTDNKEKLQERVTGSVSLVARVKYAELLLLLITMPAIGRQLLNRREVEDERGKQQMSIAGWLLRQHQFYLQTAGHPVLRYQQQISRQRKRVPQPMGIRKNMLDGRKWCVSQAFKERECCFSITRQIFSLQWCHIFMQARNHGDQPGKAPWRYHW